MTELITMSRKETDRLTILRKVQEGSITQLKAGEILDISDRQIRNLLHLLGKFGPKGIISKKRGKPSNHKYNELIQKKVLELMCQYYDNFAPTLASEKLLENHKIKISRETLRKWMIETHLWIPKTRRQKLHRPRLPKEYFGEMLQGDGSHHDWFEIGKFCALIYFIDDATGKITAAKFEKTETLEGYFDILREHLQEHGIPHSIYTDRFSVFESSIRKENLTQFRRALGTLGINWIGANSPQAKGKIERCNRTLQDRLVKEMKLKGIKTIEEGNRFLREYLPIYNKKFSKEPMKKTDLHRPLEGGLDLSRTLSKYEERTLTKDLTFQFHNKHYIILETTGCFKGKKVEIRVTKEGKLRVFDNNNELKISSLNQVYTSEKQVKIENLWPTKYVPHPKANHPWKTLAYQMSQREKELKAIGV